ncbi:MULTISPECIES: hypothetical protein [unclassified Methylobacterium]|uniref:hypothetical protein n=1 Tax=unclassified Methylobacterium TaxID=2615210 RepID=UPI002269D2B7|nr:MULTISPECIES: hypothetical protein [unclassified Methylobacterium]
MSDQPNDPLADMKAAEDQLTATNVALAEWTARKLEDSSALIERLEQMGYDVCGKSREAVAEVLKHPPTRPVA